MAMPLMCCGADVLGVPSRKQVVIVGQKGSREFNEMLAAAHKSYNPNIKSYNPNITVIHIDPTDAEEMGFWEEKGDKIALMAMGNFSSDKVVALVCQNFRCSPPVYNPSQLESLLD